jgi:hypothetical protein
MSFELSAFSFEQILPVLRRLSLSAIIYELSAITGVTFNSLFTALTPNI